MKLYLRHCKFCNSKIALDVGGNTRNDLRALFRGNEFNCSCGTCHNTALYNVKSVQAETDANSAAGGAVLGGVVGLLGGPLGAILGAIIGGAIGGANDTEEVRKINTFNNSL